MIPLRTNWKFLTAFGLVSPTLFLIPGINNIIIVNNTTKNKEKIDKNEILFDLL
jgi:hypothetical protein